MTWNQEDRVTNMMTTTTTEEEQHHQVEDEESTSLDEASSTPTETSHLMTKVFNFDQKFQAKIIQAMMDDHMWASQFSEVLSIEYFSYNYLKIMAKKYLGYYSKYKEFPSQELFISMMKEQIKASGTDKVLLDQVKNFLLDVKTNKNLNDLPYVKDQALSWCKKQALLQALDKSLTLAENEDGYEKIVDTIQKAVAAGNTNTIGISLADDIDARYSETYRNTVPTGIPEFDHRNILNGGLGAGELGIVVAPSGCHEKGYQILMYDGTFKKVEDVCVGDQLMSPDSSPRNVLSLVRGRDKMYQVSPKRYHKPFVVNQNHVLSLKSSGHDMAKSNGEETDISVVAFLGKTKWFQTNHKLWSPSKPILFEKKTTELSIDPYVLGLMIGDGQLSHGRVEVTTADSEISDALFEFASERNIGLSKHTKAGNKATGWYFTNSGKHNSKLRTDLRELGLIDCKSQQKFIPESYKTASVEVRRQILAGLIDTDGSQHNNTFDFCVSSEKLAEDVAFIARSLGMVVHESTRMIRSYPDNVYWRLSISGDTEQIPVRLARKKSKPRKQIKRANVTGFSLDEVGENDYFGFQVDGDNLYLGHDFLVHHNCGKSHMLVGFGANALLEGKNVVHYTFELNERVTGIRYDSNLLGISSTDCFEHKEEIKAFYSENQEKLGQLVIKYYPTSSITVQTIRSHLHKLSTKGMRPDLILIDYIGIMRSSVRYELPRLEMKKVCEEVRELGGELQIPIWTALQSNKEGANSEVVDLTNMAESYAQAAVADFVLGLSRPSLQKSTGLATLFIAKNRAGIDGLKYKAFVDTARSKVKILTDEESAYFDVELERGKHEEIADFMRKKLREMNKS